MTIIEPKKNKIRLNFLYTLIIGLILAGALLSVFSYNQSVSLTHRLSETLKSIEDLRVANADLKNSLYSILDLQNADQLAGKLGLIKERKPEYLAASHD